MSTHHSPNQPGKSDQAKPTKHAEQHPHAGKTERNVDAAVESTFPASDPPSIGGVTKIKPKESDHSERKGTKGKH